MFYMNALDYDNYCASFSSTYTKTGKIITILLNYNSPSNEKLLCAEMPAGIPSGITGREFPEILTMKPG